MAEASIQHQGSSTDPILEPTETNTIQADSVTQVSNSVHPESPDGAEITQPQPLSKNAIKKAARDAKFAANKLERRAREKEVKKEKKRVKAEKRAAGELDEEDENQRRRKKPKLGNFAGRVVVDIGFDDMMNDKEIKSLTSQLAYTYSANRQASFPFSLIFSSLNGRTFTRLESMSDASYKRWSKTEWWEESYERLWQDSSKEVVSEATESSQNDAGTAEPKTNHRIGSADPVDKRTVVYLTADSEEELTELKPDEIYIIGGICDHNRYKNLCLNKANTSGIRSARLPISRYISSLPTRKVLTVNQVFEILLRWVETRDWEDAFYSIIPKRKFITKGAVTVGDEGADAEGDDGVVGEEEVMGEPELEEVSEMKEDAAKGEASLVATVHDPE